MTKPQENSALLPGLLSTATRKSLMKSAYALGVPQDYGLVRGLAEVREPKQLVSIGPDVRKREQWMIPAAADAWHRMRAAAVVNVIELQIVSAFRSVEYQLGIIQRKVERGLSMDEILRFSSAPGYSEHHSGRAIDITTPGFSPVEPDFEQSAAFAWLCKNAKNFGFGLSYPRDNQHAIAYEPWHWCWQEKKRARPSSSGTDKRDAAQ